MVINLHGNRVPLPYTLRQTLQLRLASIAIPSTMILHLSLGDFTGLPLWYQCLQRVALLHQLRA